MEINILNAEGKAGSKVELSPSLFGTPYKEGLIHQVIKTFNNNAREAISSQKSRSDVRGGGAKPWKQKGTGRARAGTSSSPLWRSGGVTFANVPVYNHKINKKMYSLSIKSILAQLNRDNRICVIEEWSFDKPSTKSFILQSQKYKLTNALLVVDNWNENLYLSARNLNSFDVCEVHQLNPVLLLSYNMVCFTKSSFDKIQERHI